MCESGARRRMTSYSELDLQDVKATLELIPQSLLRRGTCMLRWDDSSLENAKGRCD